LKVGAGSPGAGDEDVVARDLGVFWHPCTQMRDHREHPPFEVVAARGCRLELADGRVVLDAIASWWCKSLGHRHPRVLAAIAAQLERFDHVIVAGVTHAPLVRLCERLLALANGLPASAWGPAAPAGRPPGHFARVFLADNGSTGVEIALKLALQAQAQRGQPGRTRFAAFANGYHGETVGALSVGDLGLYGAPFAALTFPVEMLGPLPYRAGPHDPRWLDVDREWPAFAATLDRLAPTLAAIIYEPVLQAAGGMRLYSPALLARLAAWARERGVYLIADEIAAGMGRLGAMLATHLAGSGDGVLPDFAILAKGLTGGALPLSAVLTTDEVYRHFDADYGEGKAFLHSNTHTGNALAVAAALGALNAYAEEDVLGQVCTQGALLRDELTALAAARPFVRNVRAAGLVGAIDLTDAAGAPLDPARRTGFRVYREAVRRGALLRPLGDTMYLCPPLTTSPAELRAMLAILAESVDAVVAPLSGQRL
jgi:adenosylmethionine-8-amino-7-oxononanoate aminotransferase